MAVIIVGERLTPIGWTGLSIIALVLVILAAAPTNAVPQTPAIVDAQITSHRPITRVSRSTSA